MGFGNHGDILLRSDQYDETRGNDCQHDGERCSTQRSAGNCRKPYRRSSNLGIDRGYLRTNWRNYRGTRGGVSRSSPGSGGSASCVTLSRRLQRQVVGVCWFHPERHDTSPVASDFIVNASFTDQASRKYGAQDLWAPWSLSKSQRSVRSMR